MSLAEYGYTISTKPAGDPWGEKEYKILHADSGGGTFARDGSQAGMRYIVEYYHVEKFLDVVLGKTVKVGSELRRSAHTPDFDADNGSLPEEHPWFYNFFAASADVSTRGVSQNLIEGPSWNKAVVTVVFRPPTYNVLSDSDVSELDLPEYNRFVSTQTEVSTEFLTSTGPFKFVTSGNLLPLDKGQTIALLKYNLTWHQIPVALRSDGKPNLVSPPNIATIKRCLGKLNDDIFMGYGKCAVLLMNATWKLVLPQAANENNYYWDIGYSFGVRDYGPSAVDVGERIGWNYVYDTPQKAWDLVTTSGTFFGGKLYEYDSLDDLFKVDW